MIRYIKHILSVLIIVGLYGPGMLVAQTFDEFKKQREAELQRFKENYTKEYNEFARKEKEGIEKLKKELAEWWGRNDAKVSTQKEWVGYSRDKKTRTDVNFEDGVVKVEVLLTPEDAENTDKVKSDVRSAVKNMVYETCSVYEGDAEKGGLLNGQLKTLDGKPVSTRNAELFADELVMSNQIVLDTVRGADGISRVKVTLDIHMVPDHIIIRAQQFKPIIRSFAGQYEIPEQLIFAVVDAESTFNPLARSYVPAYGLMQIVPKFAGRDAFNYIYKKDTIVTADYLYVPDNNIRLGTAYFKLLTTHYFKGISNSQSRILCAIAAYNTGTGNVYKAFKGVGNKAAIFERINSMRYDELFNYLKENLPSAETRNYIQKVTRKMQQYNSWLAGE